MWSITLRHRRHQIGKPESSATALHGHPDRQNGSDQEDRPPLDLALQRIELVKRFPLFADLDAPVRKRLVRALRTRYVNAGDHILRKDSPSRRVFFIASGAVELQAAGQTWRLGRGEMFGQLGVLMQKPRRTEARAIVPSTLLVLDETRFRRLVKRSPILRETVRKSAEKRGITLDQSLSDSAQADS